MNLSQLDDRIQEIAESSQDMVMENRHLEEQIREIERNQKELAQAVWDLESQNSRESRNVEELTARLDEDKEKREHLAKDLSAVQLDNANLQQKYQFVQENVRRVRSEMEKLEEEKNTLSGSTKQAARSSPGNRMRLKN